MIEMHVSEENVFYVFGLVSEFWELMDNRFVWVEWHVGDNTKELRKPGGAGIILQAKSRIHEGESLIGFNQYTDQSRLPIAWDAGTTGKTVEDANGHIVDYSIKTTRAVGLLDNSDSFILLG